MSTTKIARYRNTPYTYNYIDSGITKVYNWSGSKGNKVDIKDLPNEAVDWLLMNSKCFKDGELAIIEDTPEAKEMVENIDDLESYKNNTHSKEEIIKLLEGNVNKMKSELKKITLKEEMKFIIDVAKEIKVDSSNKQKLLAEMIGIDKEILFSE